MQRRPLPRPLALAGALFLTMAILTSLNLEERTARQRSQIFDIAMATAEQGGFTPGSLRLPAGQTVTLRFHAGDVAHAVAIGPGLDIDLGVIAPGQTREFMLRIERPGVYTFYCNLWCSPEHWRMRGVIDVVDTDGHVPPAPADPVVARLTAQGIDIDAMQRSGAAPNPFAGDRAFASEPLSDLDRSSVLGEPDRQHSLAPVDAFETLRRTHPDRVESELAATTAAWWVANSRSNPDLAGAADLYAKNCAACHGTTGRGDGVASTLASTAPAAFTAATLFDRRTDVLYAKIRRGGMGTGMPNFGTLFTPEETWGLVDYLWLLAFDAEAPTGE